MFILASMKKLLLCLAMAALAINLPAAETKPADAQCAKAKASCSQSSKSCCSGSKPILSPKGAEQSGR
jgi:hypothetical protein